MAEDRRRRAGSTMVAAASIVVIGIVTAASALTLAAAASASPSMFTLPWSIASFAACCAGLAAFAGVRLRDGDREIALPALAVSAAFTLWLCAIAAMSWWVGVEEVRGPWAIALVTIAGSLHVPVVTLLISFALTEAPRWRRGLWAIAVPTWVLGALLVEPVNPWGRVGTVWESAAGTLICTVLTLLWVIVVIACPVVLWLRAARSPLDQRARRVLAAVAVTAPLLGVLLATAAGALLDIGTDRAALGSAAIVGVCASSVVSAICSGWARSTVDHAVPQRAWRSLILAATVPPLAVLVTISAALLGDAAGRQPVVTVVIALVVAAAAALGATPLVRRMIGLADPSPEEPAAIAPTASVGNDTAPAPASIGVHFTAREIAVATRIAGGLSNAGIARELHLSERTVHAHVRAIYAKLGLTADGEHNQRVNAANAFRPISAEMPMPTASTDQ